MWMILNAYNGEKQENRCFVVSYYMIRPRPPLLRFAPREHIQINCRLEPCSMSLVGGVVQSVSANLSVFNWKI